MTSQFFLGLALIISLGVSLYGWGRAVALVSYGKSHVACGFAMALGVAAWICLGGMLMAFSIVRPYALWTIIGLGLVAVCYFAWMGIRSWWIDTARRRAATKDEVSVPRYLCATETQNHWRPVHLLLGAFTAVRQWLPMLFCYGCLIAVFIFQLLTILPARQQHIHIHDDLMLYLPRIERIAQTGGINDLFDPVGLDGLGAMPLLQSFIYSASFIDPAFSVPYIYGFDSVLCYLLCALLVVELARELGLGWGHALLAMVLFLSIRIDEHNASPVYAGSLMVLLTILATCRLARHASDSALRYRAAIPVGLALAGMTALKLSFALFAGCYLLLVLVGAIVSARDVRARVALVFAVGLTAAATTFPWIAAVGDKYLMVLHAGSGAPIRPGSVDSVLVAGPPKLWAMVSPERNWALGSRLAYLVMMVLAAVACVVAVGRLWRRDRSVFWTNLACVAATAGVVISLFFWQFFGLDVDNNMRYLGPLPAAVLPAAALLLMATSAAGATQTEPARNVPRRWPGVIVAAQALVIGLFLETTVHRAQDAWKARQNMVRIQPSRLRTIQATAPRQQRILAWVKTPQYLDFARNEICLVYQSGLVAPWLDFPTVANAQTADEFFSRYHIRFLLRERMDPRFPTGDNDINWMHASRLAYFHKMGRNFAMLRDLMNVAEQNHKAIYNDGQIVLIDLAQ